MIHQQKNLNLTRQQTNDVAVVESVPGRGQDGLSPNRFEKINMQCASLDYSY
jgi:hypothetical protein